MSDGTLFWMITFGLFAIIFFIIAVIVTVRGMSEIKELFNDPELHNHD